MILSHMDTWSEPHKHPWRSIRNRQTWRQIVSRLMIIVSGNSHGRIEKDIVTVSEVDADPVVGSIIARSFSVGIRAIKVAG